MNSVSHVNYGLWRHPRDQLGLLDTHGGSAAASLRTGTQSPVDDPLLSVSALAAATTDSASG